MKTKLVLSVISLLMIFAYSESMSEANWTPPQSIQGEWSGKHKVTVRVKTKGKFSFLKAPDFVNLSLIIDKNEKVTGTLGGAVFQDCVVRKNRGWVGKTLDIKTDFIIQGKLNGAIFPEDAINNKIISLPFNLKGQQLDGSLFQIDGLIDMFPMVDVKLYKEKNK